jgi:hypothetical protein
MSFRLFISNIRRASLAGLVCLAFAGALRAEDAGSRRIEIVPFHDTRLDTNFDQAPEAATSTPELLSPHAPRTLQDAPRSAVLPMPRSQPPPTQREKELLDRRRNWVFMTPEEFASSPGKKDSDPDNQEKSQEGSLTLMERYYQRLNDGDHTAATNRMARADTDPSHSRTNSFTGQVRDDEAGTFGPSPFNTTPDSGIFQSARPNDFSSDFNSANDAAMPSPEEVRQQAEQKTRIDTFKELWNIDQSAAAPATAVSAPVSGPLPMPVDSAPVFGASQSGRSLLNANSPGGFSSQQQPSQPSMTSRSSAPPRATFTFPQRPF